MLTRAFSASALAVLVFVLSGGAISSSPLFPVTPAPAASSPLICWDSSCYRTYEQAQTFLQSVASSYPGIASLTDAGLSWEGTRHLWLLRLTNNARQVPKPAVFMVGEQRPRDVTTSEVLLRYISYLVQNYGADPDVTWLLDNRELWILPISNPDGYYQLYGNAQCSRAKNTDSANGCANALYWGTDLNRNYPFHWNSGGASADPCDTTYPGPSALSEPESAHILEAFTASGASLVLNMGAPLAGTGGPNIRYPWGWSAAPPPDAAGLDALGWALARLNGTPRGSVSQHNRGGATVVSGILDDTVYGQYGRAALTMNIGDTPFALCQDLDALAQQQRPALIYAAKAAGAGMSDTLSRPFGPTPLDVSVSGATSSTIQLTAVLSSNVGTVEGAVYKIDEPSADGEGLPMSGNFGGGIASVSATVDLSGLPNGRHLLLVQGKNDSNRWGVLSAVFFTVTTNFTATPTPSSTRTPTPIPTPSVTPTPTRTATGIATSTHTSTPTYSPSATYTRTATPTLTPTVTLTPSPVPDTPTPSPGCTLWQYESGDVPALIPDPGTLTSTLTIPGAGVVADLDLAGLTIQHDSLGDLTVSLTSPLGTTVRLFEAICGHVPGFYGITLDDGAPSAIGEVCPPAPNGRYRPASPLSVFNGEDARGTWVLTVTDRLAGYSGALSAWGLSVTTGQFCSTPTSTPTVTPTSPPPTNTATPTRTPTSTRTPTLTRTATGTRTPTVTRTATLTYTPSATRTPTGTHTPRPTATLTPLPCSDYSDVRPSNYFYQAVDWLTCRGIVSGYADGTFRPFSNTTRAQIIKMAVLGEGWPIYEPTEPTFYDVQPSDWFYGVVETGYIRGIIRGYGDGTFRPFNNVTRGQLSKVIVLARRWTLLDPEVAHFSDVPRGSAFYTYVETAQAHGLVSGYADGTFRPMLNATRGQLSTMLYAALLQQPGP